ncbi:MAG: AlbA family DNA-binding domain-containing protein [Pirellulaceae bacterium]
MDAATKLFEALRAFRTDPISGKSSQQSMLDYCSNNLGGVERIHFDFKEKSQASIPQLDDNDKRNLAKAVSGFSNGSGGVLIWGIEDSSISPRPISRVSEFVDCILQMAHQIADPPVQRVDGDFVPSDQNTDSGFGLILIPESELPPHRVVLSLTKVQNHYYTRTGSSFVIATHAQLEDMFGRRPRPKLDLTYRKAPRRRRDTEFDMSIIVSIRNIGRGLAKYPFLSLEVDAPHVLSGFGLDGNGRFGLPVIEEASPVRRGRSKDDYRSCTFGSQDGFVIHSGMTHPVTLMMVASTSDEAVIHYALAAEGLPVQRKELRIPITELRELPES